MGVFWGPDDQKCSLPVLLRFVVWGSERSFLGVLIKIKIFFFLKKDSNYFKMIHRNKSLKKLFFMGAWNKGLIKKKLSLKRKRILVFFVLNYRCFSLFNFFWLWTCFADSGLELWIQNSCQRQPYSNYILITSEESIYYFEKFVVLHK